MIINNRAKSVYSFSILMDMPWDRRVL